MLCHFAYAGHGHTLIFCGSVENDLYRLLQKEAFPLRLAGTVAEGVHAAAKGDALIIVADGYPAVRTNIPAALLQAARRKQLRIYMEYPQAVAGLDITGDTLHTQLERGVVTTTAFGSELKPMSILGINDCYLVPVKADSPLIVLAKVAGLDQAAYGISDVPTFPLLFRHDNMLLAATKMTNFATGRYGPDNAWKAVWAYILTWLTGREVTAFQHWPADVTPMYTRSEKLPANAQAESIRKGVEWFSKARFFIHPDWKDQWKKYQSDGRNPVGPPLPADAANGNGLLGLLEGHASRISYNGQQQYRYWLRADVQGEAAYALAAAGKYLHNADDLQRAANLIDFVFNVSNLRAQERNKPGSASYGLLGWSDTHPYVYYGDDNARAILGMLGASAYLGTDKWDLQIVENILANFRTTGKNGFRSDRIEDKALQQHGWQYYQQRDVINPAPHFESWMWALYLWLYEKTGYQPLLEKTKTAIRITMEAYPAQWKWTNGIQQERARMVLPLAWLVRVEDTPEHRRWLDTLVRELLRNQDACGAIREELGSGKGKFGRTLSNKDYGLHEAPLIFANGDPIADMLYTSNFAFFSLNEAAHATGNGEYKAAVGKLADFLTRIQVKSEQHRDLDGAWFRAFEFNRWEYWASNADVGWGAWNTLTGWTQSWIVATQVLTAQQQNFWDLTRQSAVKTKMPSVINHMFRQ
ncbi:hypothetical protein ICL07_03720 [Chitinophaga qingshengii]|uniref:Alpha-L-rhamnosidase six-hairpin glycosidase domain-containing protein n=1 Tax=Chitinophaga qingshengii TaxID=1569794 RepID=A0ABR7TGB5_9BACT|nr:hypothetical protein [Chitinophaga qingshengii]